MYPTREPMNIVLRRRAEERHLDATKVRVEHQRLAEIADFEKRSTNKVHGALMRKKIEEQNKLLREQIDDRRRKLASLLSSEREQYEHEIEASFETPEQVKERMFAYARQLKAESEARRKALADELEQKRFRQQSDVLRSRASAITAERTALDRLSQLEEKQKLRELEKERDAREATLTDATTAKMFDRAAVEAEARRRLEAEMKLALDAQLTVKRDLSVTAKMHEAEVENKLLEDDSAAARAQRQAEWNRRQAAREEYVRVQEFNAQETAVRQSTKRAEEDADRADLAFALQREEDAIARERAAVEERKRETLEFKKKLDEQTAIQAEDKGWMDKYYKEEADKAWEKREITWRAEAEARRRLMNEVAVTRVLQMEDKKAQAAVEGERDAIQLDIWRREQEAAEARERERVEARRRMGETHAEQTRQQLSDRARQRALEKQAEFLEWKMQEKTEKEYAARVQALLRDETPIAK